MGRAQCVLVGSLGWRNLIVGLINSVHQQADGLDPLLEQDREWCVLVVTVVAASSERQAARGTKEAASE